MGRKKGPPTPWEIAKPLLEMDYLSGEVTDEMFPRHVRELRTEYKNVPVVNFRTNFRAMKIRIGEHKNRSMRDFAAYLHDMEFYTLAVDDSTSWDGSDAQRLLMVDVKAGMLRFMKPKLLWVFREEYQKFSLDVFRAHCYQEHRSEFVAPYWIKKRKEKLIAEKERLVVDDSGDDVDFFEEYFDETE